MKLVIESNTMISSVFMPKGITLNPAASRLMGNTRLRIH